MIKNIQNYFTTGELSQLCKIPRKTLLYYDKLGLITPELVDENGYRYYKRSQLFLLQLILTLRQLDVPIARIKDYLANRSPQNYRDLFNERIDFFYAGNCPSAGYENRVAKRIRQARPHCEYHT